MLVCATLIAGALRDVATGPERWMATLGGMAAPLLGATAAKSGEVRGALRARQSAARVGLAPGVLLLPLRPQRSWSVAMPFCRSRPAPP